MRTNMNSPKGFEYRGDVIKFIDEKGKDVGFNRWRCDLYYHPNWAKTKFLHDELSYQVFLAKYRPLTFESYEAFRRSYGY